MIINKIVDKVLLLFNSLIYEHALYIILWVTINIFTPIERYIHFYMRSKYD